MPQIIIIKLIFPSVFAGNAWDSYEKIKADDVGTLTSTILIAFQFDVTSIPTDCGRSFVGHNVGHKSKKSS